MCGARIGALISKNKEVMAAALKFGQARLSPPTIDQVAAEAALATPQSYFDEVVDEYVARRNIMVDGLNAIPGVFCPKPKGAFYCVARFPVDDAEKFCQWLLESCSFEGQNRMMAPAQGLNQDSLRKAVDCLRVALEEYPGTIR
jgi:aspartate aminotransferase